MRGTAMSSDLAKRVVSGLLQEIALAEPGLDPWDAAVERIVAFLEDHHDLMDRIMAQPAGRRHGALAMVLADPDVGLKLGPDVQGLQSHFNHLPPDTVVGLARAVGEVLNAW